MGLDQYAYIRNIRNREDKQLCYWRKHPNLEGWMRNVWEQKGCPNAHEDCPDFNGVELELDQTMIDSLEKAVNEGTLPETRGFYFGQDSSDYYKQQDLQFIADAREILSKGERIYYCSSW
jgi:hypothetical protein